MIRKTIILGAALLGLAIPAVAQGHSNGSFGRHTRVHADIGHNNRNHHAPRPAGYGRTVREQVYIPGCFRDEYRPPRYGWLVDSCGQRRWGVIEPGGSSRVWVPPYYATRPR